MFVKMCVRMSFCFLCFIRNVFYGYFLVECPGVWEEETATWEINILCPGSSVNTGTIHPSSNKVRILSRVSDRPYPDLTSWGKKPDLDPSIVCKYFPSIKTFYQKMTGFGSETLTLSYLCTVQYNYIAQI